MYACIDIRIFMHALYLASAGVSAEGGGASRETHTPALFTTHRACEGADVQLLPSLVMVRTPPLLQPGHVERCLSSVYLMRVISVFFCALGWGLPPVPAPQKNLCPWLGFAFCMILCDDGAFFFCFSSCKTYLLVRSFTGTCVFYMEQ